MSRLNLFYSYRDLTREIKKELKKEDGDRLEELLGDRALLQEKVPPASELNDREREEAINLLQEVQQMEVEITEDLREALQGLGNELNKVEQARQLVVSYQKLEEASGVPRMIDRKG